MIYQRVLKSGGWTLGGDMVGTTHWHYKDRARIDPYSSRIEFHPVVTCYEGTSKSRSVFIVSNTLQQHNRIMILNAL